MINEMIRYQGHQRAYKYSMEAMVNRYLGKKYTQILKELTGYTITKDIRTTYTLGVPLTIEQVQYAAADIYLTYKIYEQQCRWLWKPHFKLTSKLENKFTIVLAAIELKGMPFNREM